MWKYKTDNYVLSSPCISNGKLYIGNQDGYLSCLSLEDGGLLWKYRTNGSVYSTPFATNEYVYFGSKNGFIYCLSKSEGNMILSFKNRWSCICITVCIKRKYICWFK
ncbi:MAG: outer membrane protein assembly factor BamB family protein [bacterium]